MSESTIAIIGAGASGIGTAKAFREAGLNFEIIEKTSRFGGNWQPDGAASKMYRSAHLISSKRNSQFSDFPMPESYPHYPHHSLMYQYLESIADHFELAASTRFETKVEQTHQNRNGDWELAFTDGSSKTYQGLVVCNGLLRRPITPAMAKDFSGRSLHAADYRTNTDFEGQTVLVVGGGNSGCDIAVDVAQTAGKVLHSTRRGYHYMPKFISGKPTQEWLMEQSQYFSTPEEYWEHVCKTFKLAGFDGVDFGLETPDHHISEAHPIMNSNILYAIGHGDIDPKENLERIDGSVC
ncbi:MAG: NAD(P)/FAD-dependent oxidoreductase, partial [Pseudomonadota bacterium]